MGIINLEECFRTVNTVGHLALMRRLSVGCTTDAHALYATFMSRLSRYIYLWDPEDIEALIAVGSNACRKPDG